MSSDLSSFASALTQTHGPAQEARCLSQGRIELVFADGTVETLTSRQGFTCGYNGTGCRLLHQFLRLCGFTVSEETIYNIKLPGTILRDGSIFKTEEQKRAEEAERRAAEEQRKLVETERRAAQERTEQEIAKRREEGRCVHCGKALGFADRLIRRTQHKACTIFEK